MTDGDKLENDAANYMEQAGFEVELTRASGQVRGDGDVISREFMAECKYKSTEGFDISKKDFDKAISQGKKQNREVLFFSRNKHGKTIVSMDIESWIRWIRKE